MEIPSRNSIMAGSGHGRRKAQPIQMLKCPRCDSLNTKFCYYNNYNLSQPRHFCKNCRRYWTNGGALRNIPVGGGCRKNKTSAKQLRKPGSSATAQPASASQSSAVANFSGVSGPLEFQLNQDRLLLLANFSHFPPSEPSAAENWSDPSNMEEAGEPPALGLWDSQGGNGVFPYNIDCGGEPLFEMQIGDFGCLGGGSW